jgi:Ca-activated chloride channel family protein
VQQLRSVDRVAIAVYAGASGLVLASTPGDRQRTILETIRSLGAGGSTNGAGGIQLAYDVAQEAHMEGGVNRVILATDGDFNVGITDRSRLIELIESEARRGIFLSVLGVGMGHLHDGTLEQLADKGNGNYAYIDSPNEARKVLVEQMSGTLVTVAKDVKIQVEFNPSRVQAYRLIGYENRALAAEDFNNDAKDAGEVGAGHRVTALYEVVPPGVALDVPDVDPLQFQSSSVASDAGANDLLVVKVRYKAPENATSRKLTYHVEDNRQDYQQASPDFKFAAAVAGYGMLLRHSQRAGVLDSGQVRQLARAGLGDDPSGYRSEFLTLVDAAERLGY